MKTVRVKLFVLALFLVAGCGTPEKKAFPVRAPFEVGSYSFVADKYGRYIFEISWRPRGVISLRLRSTWGGVQGHMWNLRAKSSLSSTGKFVNRTRNALVQQGEGIQVDSRCRQKLLQNGAIVGRVGLETKLALSPQSIFLRPRRAMSTASKFQIWKTSKACPNFDLMSL